MTLLQASVPVHVTLAASVQLTKQKPSPTNSGVKPIIKSPNIKSSPPQKNGQSKSFNGRSCLGEEENCVILQWKFNVTSKTRINQKEGHNCQCYSQPWIIKVWGAFYCRGEEKFLQGKEKNLKNMQSLFRSIYLCKQNFTSKFPWHRMKLLLSTIFNSQWLFHTCSLVPNYI